MFGLGGTILDLGATILLVNTDWFLDLGPKNGHGIVFTYHLKKHNCTTIEINGCMHFVGPPAFRVQSNKNVKYIWGYLWVSGGTWWYLGGYLKVTLGWVISGLFLR